MQICLVMEARFYDDFLRVRSAHVSAESAEAKCMRDGYRFDTDQGFYVNPLERCYRKLRMQELIDDSAGDSAAGNQERTA